MIVLLSVISYVSQAQVNNITNPGAGPYATIQAAINNGATVAGDIIEVSPGTYVENVTINKNNIVLRSTGGKALPTIQGITTANAGTVMVSNGTNGVTIGQPGKGFTIIGFDGSGPGESAAIYLLGAHTNITIEGNEIRADGDHGLLSLFNAAIDGIYIRGNEFTGKTFLGPNPGGCGFATQFDPGNNVPRQLVTMGGGASVTQSKNVYFLNNMITGTAGSFNAEAACATFGQGNNLVTIDVIGCTISGNTFNGVTTRFSNSLRTRGPGASIYCNTFFNAGLGAACGNIFLGTPAPLGSGASPSTLAGIASSNSFPGGGAYITPTGSSNWLIYKDLAQATAALVVGQSAFPAAVAGVTCPGNIVVCTDANVCTAVVSYTVSTSGFPTPTVSYELSGATTAGPLPGTGSGASFNKGVTTVKITVSSGCGTSDCSFTVTVNDTEKPTITCPGNITVDGATTCGTTVSFATPVATDNCGTPTVMQIAGLSSGSVFPIGVTTVTFRATDACGNTSTCSFTVTVNLNPLVVPLYTILAQEEVHVHTRNIVNGNVGVWGAGKDAKIHDFSTVNGFVRAPVIDKDASSTITGAQTLAQAPQPTPGSFRYNTMADPPSDITVPDNFVGTYNLAGTSFRKITVGKNSTALFTSSGDIYIKELILKDADNGMMTKLEFSGNSELMIRKKLDIGKRNSINQAGTFNVKMYVEEYDVHVGQASKVNASIDVRFKELKPETATSTAHTTMQGRFIAKKVDAKDYIDWNGICGTSPGPIPENEPEFVSRGVRPLTPEKRSPESFGVSLFPNPSYRNFTIKVTGLLDELITVNVSDMAGKVLLNYTTSSNTIVIDGTKLAAGTYLAEIRQGSYKKVMKLVKIN